MTKQEKEYVSLVQEYNEFIYLKANTIDASRFAQVKKDLLEFVNRFLYLSQKEQVFADLYKKRKYENKERSAARLLHNINRHLPLDEIDCQSAYFEYRLMFYMPWGNWVTVPQACMIACIAVLVIWVFFG